MNLEDLMAVWRSQDTVPLHSVNRTLLHLALRQDEAKLQKQRRRERWTLYVFSGGVLAGMGLFLALMTYHLVENPERTGLSIWDLGLPLVGGASALVSAWAIYRNHRAQMVREGAFGESLLDQLRRSIAQLNDQMSGSRQTSLLVTVLMGAICPTAILIAGWRVNQKSLSDDGYLLVTMIVVSIWSAASGAWELRRQMQQEILPRKRRLEKLLQEVDLSEPGPA